MKTKQYQFWYGTMAVLLFLFLQSCGTGGSKVSFYVPKDVSFVIKFDLQRINQKAANWRELFDNNNISEGFALEDEAVAKEVLTILDNNSAVWVFGLQNTEKFEDNYTAVAMQVKSDADFENALKKSKKQASAEKDKDFTYVIVDERSIISWKDGLVVSLTKENKTEKSKLVSLLQTLRKTTANESAQTQIAAFKALDNNANDIISWSKAENSETLGRNLGFLAGNEFMNGIIEKTEITTTSNFENGKIEFKYRFLVDKDKQKRLALFKAFSDGILGSMPISDPVASLGLAMNMSELYSVLEAEKGIEDLKPFAKQVKLSEKELFETFSGELLFSIDNIQFKTLLTKPAPDAVIAVKVANKANLAKIFKAMEGNDLKKEKDYYVVKQEGLKLFIIEKGDYVYLASSEKMLDAIKAGTVKMSNNYQTSIKNKLFALRFDIAKLNAQVPKEEVAQVDTYDISTKVAPKIEYFSISLDGIKENTVEGSIIFAFANATDNALKTIIEMVKATNSSKKTS